MAGDVKLTQQAVQINYVPPASNVAGAIQYPMYEPHWASRVINAYARDLYERRARNALASTRDGGGK